MVGSGVLPGGWGVISPNTMGGTKTTSIADGSADLPLGDWLQVACDTVASGGGYTHYGSTPIPVNPGDVVYFQAYIKKTGGGGVSFRVWNVTATGVLSSIANAVDGAAPKFCAAKITVPVGCTSIRPELYISTATGESVTASIGCVQAWNLTALGLI